MGIKVSPKPLIVVFKVIYACKFNELMTHILMCKCHTKSKGYVIMLKANVALEVITNQNETHQTLNYKNKIRLRISNIFNKLIKRF